MFETTTRTVGANIIIDGIDGTGKTTQTDLAMDRAAREGFSVTKMKFPCAEQPVGAMIYAMLNGKFGPLESISPRAQAMFFAADQHEAMSTLRGHLTAETNVLCDRYLTSNIGHQAAKLPKEERGAFIEELLALGYGYARIEPPTLTIILTMPVEISIQLLHERARAKGIALDQHETNLQHLKDAHETYLMLPDYVKPSVVIHCAPENATTREEMFSKEQIHEQVWQAMQPYLVHQKALAHALE